MASEGRMGPHKPSFGRIWTDNLHSPQTSLWIVQCERVLPICIQRGFKSVIQVNEVWFEQEALTIESQRGNISFLLLSAFCTCLNPEESHGCLDSQGEVVSFHPEL